jgi:hypothetical protein
MKTEVINEKQDLIQLMLPMIFGALQGKALSLMAELNIADYLIETPMSVEDLATRTETDVVAMERYTCLIEQMGLISKSEPGKFTCTQLGALLQRGQSPSLHNYALLTNSDVVLEMVQHMSSTLKSGESAFAQLYGESFYDALQNRPQQAAIFDGAMHEISEKDIPEILDSYDFSHYQSVIDVGGGQGYLLAALLDKYTHLQGTLFELADVSEQAKSVLNQYINNGRAQIETGSFLDTICSNGDLYILKRVLSHFSDNDATKLLSNIRARINPGGRLLVIDPDTASLYGASFNLLMLVAVGGSGVRSEKELSSLFASSGFKYERKTRLATELSIIEALAI